MGQALGRGTPMEAVVVIAGIVAIVWGAVVFLRGGLIGGCLAVLLAGCCFGHAWFHVSMAPIPLTLDRVLWALLLVQYVVWRRLGWADPKPLTKAEIVLVAFFAVLLLSALSHDWRIDNNRPLSQLVFTWMMPLGMYWVARQMPLGERAILLWFGSLAAFGVYLAVTAIAETQQLWWLVYPSYIGSAEFPEFLGRGRGPLLTPVGSGMFQGICLGAALLWWPRLGRVGRLAIAAASVVLVAGIYCTFTRSVWIGAALGLLIVLGLNVPRRWRIPLVAGALLVASLLALTQWERLVAFKRDQALDAEATAESVELRPILAMVAWKMFLDRPLLGCGYGQYPEISGDYTSDRSTQLVLEKARTYIQHNVVLSLLTETGLVGAGLFVMLLAIWTCSAWRLWQAQTAPLWIRQQGLLFLALMGNYAANAMFHDVSLIAMVNMLLFFTAGATMSLACRAEPAAV